MDTIKLLDGDELTQNEIEMLNNSLAFFSQHKSYFDILRDINYGNSQITLRFIDLYIASYAKEHNKGVYAKYMHMIHKYTKTYFDPFRRRKTFIYQGMKTSIGQLNFFEFIFEENIIETILSHHRDNLIR